MKGLIIQEREEEQLLILQKSEREMIKNRDSKWSSNGKMSISLLDWKVLGRECKHIEMKYRCIEKSLRDFIPNRLNILSEKGKVKCWTEGYWVVSLTKNSEYTR